MPFSLVFSYSLYSFLIVFNFCQVRKSGIGAVGVSKGGDLVCSMATFIPEVKAVVCINGIPVNTWSPLKVKDHVYPRLFFDVSKAVVSLSSNL